MTTTSVVQNDIQHSDKALILLARQGKQDAFRQLVTRYQNIIYYVIYGMVAQKETAEELTQETLIKLYNKLSQFDEDRPLKPWLLRIASNTAISYLRKNSKLVSLDAMGDAGQWKESDHPPLYQTKEVDEINRLNTKYKTQEVLETLNTLDPKFREALTLRYVEELSYEEIAQTMDIPINTVRTWIRRGRNKLMDAVAANHLTDKGGQS